MYQQQIPENQVSPIDEPSPSIGSKSSYAQPGIGCDRTGSLNYETRPDWKLDTPSEYDLNGPISAVDGPGSILDRSENQVQSDFQKAVDPRIRPEDFAQAITGWQPPQTPEKMPNLTADPNLADTYNHDFESNAASLNANNINAKIIAQQDIDEKYNLDTGGFRNEPLGSTYQVPANTRARWELLKCLVKGRDGPHDQTAGEESTASAKSAGSGSRTRPNQFQGLPPAQSSSKGMRTLMLPQIVEKRKPTEGLPTNHKAADATNTSQEPLRNQRHESAAVQQHPSSHPAPKPQQTIAHSSPSTLAAELPAHRRGVPSTVPSATLSSHPVSISTTVSAPQQVCRNSSGDTALSNATSRPPSDIRSQPPKMPGLRPKAPSPPQQHSRPTPNSSAGAAPNPPTKNLIVPETTQKQHVQSAPPHRPQQTASAVPSSRTATHFDPPGSKPPTTARQPTHEIGAGMQSAARADKISSRTPPLTKAAIVPRQGEQLSHHPEAQSRTSFPNTSPSSAPVKSSAATGVGGPMLAPQLTNTSTAHAASAPPPSRAMRIPATGSPALVHPNSAERQHSSALQPAKKPSYAPAVATTQQKLAHAPCMPTIGQAPPTTQHPQKTPSSQSMQPSHTEAQHRVQSQQKPETAPIAQPQSKSPFAPRALAPHAPPPHAPPPHAPPPHAPPPHAPPPHAPPSHAPPPHAPPPHAPPPHAPPPHALPPSATATASQLASNKPLAKPPQIPLRAAQELGGITHGTPSQVHPSQQSVTSHATHTTSSRPYTKPNEANSQGQPQAAPLSGPRGSSPIPSPKPPHAYSGTLVSPPKHPSQTIQFKHVLPVLPTSTSVTHIAPANHPAPTNQHDTPPNNAAPATQQHQASPSMKAAAGIPSAPQESTASNAPGQNNAGLHSSASKGESSGSLSSSNSSGPSRSEPSSILHTKPPNIFSTDSKPIASETQHARETEEPEGANVFELLGQLAGGRQPDGELSMEQEADNLVQMLLYGTALVFKSYIDEVTPSEEWDHIEKVC